MASVIVPARKGSLRVPGKNTRDLLGKPLVAWTYEFMQEYLPDFRIVISTNDEMVVSAIFGSKASRFFDSMQEGSLVNYRENIFIHKRRESDAEVNSRTIAPVLEIIRSKDFTNEESEEVWLLQPTSPFRTFADVFEIQELISKQESPSCVSLTHFESPHPSKAVVIEEDGTIRINSALEMPRQQLPDFFVPDGAFYISTVGHLIKNQSFYGDATIGYVRTGFETINIDTEDDFRLAEFYAPKFVFSHSREFR